MPLFGMQTFFGNVQTFRILWIRSRYGSGKTLLATRLAYELHERGIVRYICANYPSPWFDKFEDVQIVDGRADVCLILDEGGAFMQSKYKALKYIQFMRKLNVILILPSVLAPSSVVSFFRVKRVANLEVFGLPAWVFTSRLADGEEILKETFVFWKPAEVYGAYDTGAFVVDDAGAEDWLIKWSVRAAAQRGYSISPARMGATKFIVADDEETGRDVEFDLVETMRGVSEAIEEKQEQDSNLMALLKHTRRNK